MSRGKMWALGIAVIIHIFLGYALITGLALKIVKHITDPIKTVNIKDETPPPETPPPPPPKQIEIPPFVPPPEVTIENQTPPPFNPPTQSVTPNPPPPPPRPAAVAVAPPTPPAQTGPTSAASLDPRSTTTTEDDYPPASLRGNEEGVVTVNLSINAQGRVDGCNVAQTSGFTRLDEKTCQIALRRFRGKPALQNGTPVASSKVQRVRWQIPKG